MNNNQYAEMHKNAKTGEIYQGKNQEILKQQTFDFQYMSFEWATFLQFIDMKRCVKKGEKATYLLKMGENVNKKNGKIELLPKKFCVFNIEQTQEIS